MKKNALLISEKEQSLNFIKIHLEGLKFIFNEINDSTEIFEELGKKDYNLIIVELCKDYEERIEFIKKLREDELYKITPVLFVICEDIDVDYDQLSAISVSDVLCGKSDNIEYRIKRLFGSFERNSVLLDKQTELEELNQKSMNLLGTAAHDIRNPLNVISSYTSLLLTKMPDKIDDKFTKFLNKIKTNADYIFDLVNEFLDMSKVELGKIELVNSECDITSQVEFVISSNAILAEKKQIEIELKIVGEIPNLILIDKSKFTQILNNLLSNGIKFSYPFTKIHVTLEGLSDEEFLVSVEDQGRGIDEERLKKMFSPLLVPSERGTAGEKCTGLGLVITKKLVGAMGGTISVKSKVDVGTKFEVVLPYLS